MLYDKIKELAEERRITIYRIERDTNMSNGTISKWNDVQPMAMNVKKVADYLGVPMEVLMLAKEKEVE